MSLNISTHWNLDEHQQLQLPHPGHLEDGHTGVVYGVHLQGDRLVSVSADKTARIWDLKTQRSLHSPLVGHTGSVIAVHSDAADDVIVTGDNGGNIMVWRYSTGEAVKTIPEAHHESVRCLHFDQRYLVTGGKDGKIKLWNRHSLDINCTDVPVFAIRPSEGGRYQEYSLLATLEGHDAAVLALRLRDNVLVSGSGDSTMCIWSLKTGQILHKVNIHQSGTVSLRYNGRFIVSGSTDKTAKVYDVDQKMEVACLEGHTGLIHSVQAVFDDGDSAEVKTVITGSYDGTVRFWEQVPGAKEWRTLHQFDVGGFEAHEAVHPDNEANDIAKRNFRIFSVDLDANRFVCAGQGPVIRFWNLRSPSK
jgi:F-box and WD-40 domain protein 1/11